MSKMSKKLLINSMASAAGITHKQATAAYEAMVACVAEQLCNPTHKAAIPDLCTIKATPRPAKAGRNPQNGAKIVIPPGWTIRFSAVKALKDAVAA
jgi:nucleoid DNA-binding protein